MNARTATSFPLAIAARAPSVAAHRRALALAAGLAALVANGPAANAQTADGYPAKPIRFVLPFPPGGGVDVIGRLYTQRLSEALGQTVVPENRPGAGGNVGSEVVTKAPPDGYTLLLQTPGMAISVTLYAKMNYDPVKDLTPIALIASIAQTLAIHPSLPARSVKELIELGRRQPGKLTFGTGGPGTANDLVCQYIRNANRLDATVVPFKGITPATLALVGGHVDAVVIGVASAVPYVQGGRLRVLAILGPRRSAMLPDVPTAEQAGFPELDAVTWYGVLGPAGLPPAIVNRLNQELRRIVAAADTRERLAAIGAEPLSSTPDEFRSILRSEIVRWGRVVRTAGAKAD